MYIRYISTTVNLFLHISHWFDVLLPSSWLGNKFHSNYSNRCMFCDKAFNFNLDMIKHVHKFHTRFACDFCLKPLKCTRNTFQHDHTMYMFSHQCSYWRRKGQPTTANLLPQISHWWNACHSHKCPLSQPTTANLFPHISHWCTFTKKLIVK